MMNQSTLVASVFNEPGFGSLLRPTNLPAAPMLKSWTAGPAPQDATAGATFATANEVFLLEITYFLEGP